MEKLKCAECGHVFDDNLKECPNCGCPASDCEKVHENSQQNKVQTILTTDTGDKHEKIIQRYAEYIYTATIIAGVLFSLFAMIGIGLSIMNEESIMNEGGGGGGGAFFVGFIFSMIIMVSFWIWATIIRAFLMIYVNISINLHEINMKLYYLTNNHGTNRM